ncbi:hypothetical protein [Burkholderia pseudomallei]|uniref:hypothetical protein n=1 Tax=Burkholderia pseudomallei TaxID=28450 RepID=UPI000A1A2B87|nr:hypothetical protein [Burkholderia pseudomallei]ARL04277.1 hypothetical protein BOC44_21140 [Burkholderia pseudomallei]
MHGYHDAAHSHISQVFRDGTEAGHEVLRRLQAERDALQRSCEQFLQLAQPDQVARARFTRSVSRLNALHDQIYLMERSLIAATGNAVERN